MPTLPDDRLLDGGRRAILAGGVGLVLALLPVPARADLGEDDDALLSRLLRDPAPRIPRRDAPYRVTRTLRLPAGRTVILEAGTRIIWEGPAGGPSGVPIGVFEAGGDDTGLVVSGGGEAVVACAAPRPGVYAAVMWGCRGFTLEGIRAQECQHVHVGARDPQMLYAAVRTDGAGANIAREVRIVRGGASYAALPVTSQGACVLSYVVGVEVNGAVYKNVASGVQWWGGDAGLAPSQNGARANERKCRDLLIRNVTVRNAKVGGIWGSMGRRVAVRDCRVEDSLDVGFDAEGCIDTSFERCTARNGHNGCFTTFALCDGIRFVDCRGVVDRQAYPLFRIYNVSQSNADNRRVEVVGGQFECVDPAGPGTMDTAMGPVQSLTITGATLRNVRIDTAFFNMHTTRIAGNTLDFPYSLGSAAAIRAGSSKSITGEAVAVPGGVTVENNRIRYTASTPGSAAAIRLREDDFNSSAVDRVMGNIVTGPFAVGVAIANASGNIGIVPLVEVVGNRFERLAPTARLLSVTQEGAGARAPLVRWDDRQTRDKRPVARRRAGG